MVRECSEFELQIFFEFQLSDMKSTKNPFRSLGDLGLLTLLMASLVAPVRAEDTLSPPTKAVKTYQLHYLAAHKPDVTALLASPPLPGSAEQSADLAETISVHQQMTPTEAAAAKAEQKFSVFSFAPIIGPFFQPGKLPKAEAFLKRIQEDADGVTDTGKNFWKRPRPYVTDPQLARGAEDLEKSFSYPSGHSTRGTVIALVLADLFPDKKDEILAVGRQIGWHRVELARHYPTDIYAGRVLAAAIVRELKTSDEFQKDFADAKEEIASALMAEKLPEQQLTTAAH
jgi:acid phosphatase (class A)